MKTRFSTVDIVAIVTELQKYIGMRVYQVYDVDNKTYLIRLNRYEEKVTLLLESGYRIHTTEYEWPKNPAPSGFTMKLRKHIKNKRLEKLSQLGSDRILDLQFGMNDAAYHVILELYDRGNLVFTDFEYMILNVLRPRAQADQDFKFIVREKYPVDIAKQYETDDQLLEKVLEAIKQAKKKDNLKKILLSVTPYGPALLDHVLIDYQALKSANLELDIDVTQLRSLLQSSKLLFNQICNEMCKGYIIQKIEPRTDGSEPVVTNVEFHPYLFQQHNGQPVATYDSFDKAIDNFFSLLEGQKIDRKTFQKEREAMDKLGKVKKDHEQRLTKLTEQQAEDSFKAGLIEMNIDLVDEAIMILRSALANQMSWPEIGSLVKEAQAEGDKRALAIKKLKFEINHFTMLLGDPFDDSNAPSLIDIDLDLSAFANARKYYNLRRQHALKEHKTIEASGKAFKSAENKTKQMLKEVNIISSIIKARKPIWFEKFIWFISSENFLVIAGRDIPQNEVIVKRYMKPGDIYVHADIHGASSVVIKNPTKDVVPPKTLNEAGTFAVCYSSAWNAKILTSAWWVFHHQVSKTAPSGEYLTTGSFMIRGKKNYLMPSHLILGFGFLFKLDEDSLERHKNERQVRQDDTMSEVSTLDNYSEDLNREDIDIAIDSQSSGEEAENETKEQDTVPKIDDENIHNKEEKLKESSPSEENEEDQPNEDGSESNDETEFPDTKVQLDVFSSTSLERAGNCDEPQVVIVPSRKIEKKPNQMKQKPEEVQEPIQKQNQPKRGKKGKMKKMKEKYKDQDDAERELKMKILASAGDPKPEKSKKKGAKKQQLKFKQPVSTSIAKPEAMSLSNDLIIEEDTIEESSKETPKPEEVNIDEEDEEDDDAPNTEEANLVNSLTGLPLADDTILYAVPVCAPYSSMQNYKYKVKVMPGTGRKGKSAKTALNIFLQDKLAQQREKDCLRSVKDQDISKNFPGKVKVSYATAKKR